MVTYIDNQGNTISVNGPGCRFCPVKNCQTSIYRGSVCSAQRNKLGLEDPQTLAERIAHNILVMDDKELWDYLETLLANQNSNGGENNG